MEFKAELAYSAKGNLKSENVNKIWIFLFYFILNVENISYMGISPNSRIVYHIITCL
jgi:hypothetical protein